MYLNWTERVQQLMTEEHVCTTRTDAGYMTRTSYCLASLRFVSWYLRASRCSKLDYQAST